jgi:hypothetical protein
MTTLTASRRPIVRRKRRSHKANLPWKAGSKQQVADSNRRQTNVRDGMSVRCSHASTLEADNFR